MAKKILAVVLAVMMAVSAMAINVFADQTIDLYKNMDSHYRTESISLDIPVYGMYGYLTAGDYMLVTLPSNWGWNIPAGTEVKWSVLVNGVPYALPTNKVSNRGDVFTAKIALGFLAHEFDGKDTTIPQSTAYSAMNVIRLVAEMTYGNEGWDKADLTIFTANDGPYRTAAFAKWYYANGTEVPGSVSYGYTWNPQRVSDTSDKAASYDFVTQEWNTTVANDSSVPLTWDHNLTNRAIVYAADSAELVVELAKPIVGQAVYTLYANTINSANPFDGYNYYPNNGNGLWWKFNNSRKAVDTYVVDGTATELRFKVDPSLLYDGTGYGTFNREFVIFENITLLNSTLMSDYLNVDRSKVGDAAGSVGRISWDASWAGNRVKLDNTAVNYASTGMAGKGVIVRYDAHYILDTVEPTKSYKVDVAKSGWNGQSDCGEINFDLLKANPNGYIVITADGTPGADFNAGFNCKVADGESAQIAVLEHGATRGYIKVSDLLAELAKRQHITDANAVDGWFQAYTNGDGTNVTTTTFAYYKEGDIDANGNPVAGHVAVDPGTEGEIIEENVASDAVGAVPVYSGQNLGADVKASRIYLNFPEPEATEPAPDETVTTPTEETDQAADDEQVDVGDVEEPAETTPAPAEQNPPTGLVLAVVPMLVAAAAAVVAKKH